MAVAAYGAARAVGGRVSGVVSGSSDPGKVAGVFLIAGALLLLYLYEKSSFSGGWFGRVKGALGFGAAAAGAAAAAKSAAGGSDSGGGSMMTPQGAGQDPNRPGAAAEAPALPPVSGQEQQLYQQNYAHPLTEPQTQQGGGYMTVPPWVWQRPGYATGN